MLVTLLNIFSEQDSMPTSHLFVQMPMMGVISSP